MSNINYLIEHIVSSIQNVYIHTADKVLKKVPKCKANSKVERLRIQLQLTTNNCLLKNVNFLIKTTND